MTETNAVLEATIVPGRDEEGWEGWEEAGGAWYQFQLVVDPSEYWPEVTCPEENPNPEAPLIPCLGPYGPPNWEEALASTARRPGDLPTKRLFGSLEAKVVTLDLSTVDVTLEPGRTYHYRVIAAPAKQTIDTIQWRSPPVYGPDQTFTTPAPEESESTPPDGGGQTASALPPLPEVLPSPLPPPAQKPRACSSRAKLKAKHWIAKLRIGVQCRRAVALKRAN